MFLIDKNIKNYYKTNFIINDLDDKRIVESQKLIQKHNLRFYLNESENVQNN